MNDTVQKGFFEKCDETLSRVRPFAPTLLRIGISLVFLWFGFSQLTNPDMWTRLVPDYATTITGQTATTLVYFNGAFEIVFGICLLLGIFTQLASFLLALHMIHIMTTVGYGPTGVRDFGLAIAAVTVFLNGVDRWTIDARRKN